MMKFEERVLAGVVLFDGAMGTQIHEHNPTDADYAGLTGCSEILTVTRPDMITSIHESYLAAGCDVIETNSFGSNEIVLSEYGIADRARELSRIAAELARASADRFSADKPRFVAGSVGPGTKLISLGQCSWEAMLHSYREQIGGLIDGGADLLLIETCQDLLQIKCALCAAHDEFAVTGKTLPIIVSITVETTGTLLVGSDIAAVIASLEPFNIFALGINCATGPSAMTPFVSQIAATWKGNLLVQPNAGLPRNVGGSLVYTLTVEEYVESMSGFISSEGVNIVGGCCGTTPAFIRALAQKIPALVPAQRTSDYIPSLASIFSAHTMQQEPAPLFIGERTNTNGSKLFREKLLSDDWEGLVDIARQQSGSGVHALDVCVAYAGRNEIADMREVMSRFVTRINLPLVIDSTESPVIEAALQMNGGRTLINSINLEDGEKRADAVCALARRYGAALIALVIDERGMAKEIADKVSIARRIHDIAVHRHGLRPQDLVFDALTFTLGSGDETLRDSAIRTIEGIRLIKQNLPGVLTVLGLSNVSFGLSPVSRRALNSVFLHECVKAGLDMAIVNLAQIVPIAQIPADELELTYDLLFNRRKEGADPLFAFIAHFDAKSGAPEKEDASKDESLPVEERISKKIIQGSKSGLAELLTSALSSRSAIQIINQVLIPAMKVVGDLFGDGKIQLPFVLQSAEAMKHSVDLLTPYMEKKDAQDVHSIVLATVRGDVHDIGKNLVDIILSNNGFKVYNLGIKTEIGVMIDKALETGASAIGMSGLLVKSTAVMKDNIEELSRRGITTPVLLGGAALTPGYVNETCAPLSQGPVVYCSDAFAGLKMMNLIKEGKLESYLAAESAKRKSYAPQPRIEPAAAEEIVIRRDIAVPKAPFLGIKKVDGLDPDIIFPYLTEEVLFRGRWGYRRGSMSKDEYDRLIETTVRPELEVLKARAKKDGLIVPAISYGYFECNSAGQDVILYKPESREELARFSFPRQKKAPFLCIADFFLPADSGAADIIALQIATVGRRAHEESMRLYEAGDYKDYLLFHGLSVETAEALAEYWHLVIRRELGIDAEDGRGIKDFVVQKYRGSRYSFGYPSCPDLSQNRLLCALVDSESIGVTITEEDEMVPEQTTSAFIVHHPQAKYFNV
jgi:5-methyltetrahydrofolate--homocysteine methyltransferase